MLVILKTTFFFFGTAMGCLSLSGTQECQAFQDYAIDNMNGPLWLRNSTSIQEVDKRLSDHEHDCGPTRYARTILCAQMIQNSSGCNPTLPSLCDDTCTIVSCYAFPYQQNCNLHNDTLSTPTTTCIHGYDNENYCGKEGTRKKGLDYLWILLMMIGWTTEAEGCNFCQAKPSDPCCTTLQCSHYSIQMIGAIIGSVIGGLILLGLVLWCWRRRYQNNNDDSTLYIPYNNSSTTSTFISPQQDTMTKKDTSNHVDNDKETATHLTYTLAKRHTDDYCFYQAIYVNVPCRPYDIVLNKGDIIYLHCYTDEDWGIGYNISTGQQGSFPMICIHSITLDQVWELVETQKQHEEEEEEEESLLKHRILYFLSPNDDPTNNTPTSAFPSDDDDSPVTPPPLLHRALGYSNSQRNKKSIGSLYYHSPSLNGL
ncbi:hypothetical protein BC941DRAFT_33468 [Chlamydoabsidia padenii]|nr:hypothetical protein BC941DRAFT_33468 [Chlamydoabsidia padenii]